jgi:hypothetical protein
MHRVGGVRPQGAFNDCLVAHFRFPVHRSVLVFSVSVQTLIIQLQVIALCIRNMVSEASIRGFGA